MKMETIQTCDWCHQQREVFEHNHKLICEACYWIKSSDQFFFTREKENLNENTISIEEQEIVNILY